MVERLILTSSIAIAGILLFYAFQFWQKRRLAPLTSQAHNSPAILYFRSDHCAPCTTQKRFLEELTATQPVRLETIDVEREPARAAQFNIMTLPTTVVVGANGQVKEINYGLADATKLARQLG